MNKIIAVTSFGPAGYAEYGKRMVESFAQFWPKEVELIVTTDCEIDPTQKVQTNNIKYQILQSRELLEFKKRHANNLEAHGRGTKSKDGKSSNFVFDAVRFSHKVFALIEQSRLMNADQLLWLDGDTRTHAPVDVDRIKSWLPNNKFAGFLDRPTLYTETGFHIFDMGHPIAKSFMQSWADYYNKDQVFSLKGWTDCHTYDAARCNFNSEHWHNLSPAINHPHPFINGVLGEVMDHMKGPRKQKGSSHARDLVTKRGGYWKTVS